VDLVSEEEEEMVPRSNTSTNRRVIQDDSDEEMAENQTPYKKTIPAYKMSETPDDEKSTESPVADPSFATPAPRVSALLKSNQTPASRLSVHTPVSRIGSANRTPATGTSWMGGPPSTAASSRSFKQKNAERYAWLEFPKDAQKREPSDPDYDPRTLHIPGQDYRKFTDFEKQYWDVKSKHFNAVVFFKKGKFYELYENDATMYNLFYNENSGHQHFDLKMTDRVNMRMVGIPESSFEHWSSQFVGKGFFRG
jgi:DNA mismatch repair protein MSH6